MTSSRPINFVIQVIACAIGLWLAVRLVSDIRFPAATDFPSGDWWKLAVVAAIFALLNVYLKPLLKAISWPVRLLTLGLFSWLMNAALLLLLAWIATQMSLGLRVGAFPPHLDLQSFVAALLGALIVSIVSLVVSEMAPQRSSWTRLSL